MKPFGWSLISTFALTAAGSPLGAPGTWLLNERGMSLSPSASVSSDMLNTLKLYAQYAGASYCNSEAAIGSTVSCSGNACPAVTAAGATITAIFAGSDTDIQGFVSTDKQNQVIVMSVRGSHSIRNWITDFEFIQKDCSSLASGCKVHYGFAKAWDEISSAALNAVKAAKAANPGYRIVFTGHSLGAAVSSLGAAYARASGLEVDIINYGSPRVGNVAFANFVSAQPGVEWRVTHLDDPVPRLPPIVFGYAHTTPEYWLDSGNAFTTDYTVDEIKVCEGVQSLGCNAVTLGLNIISHLYYLSPISGCSPIEIVFKNKRQEDDYLWWQGTSPATDVTDDELEAQLNDWVQQDIDMMS
ncbi:lipase [Xylaria arbuscula]|nr:lipase [Xylaria arbuscula]